MPKISVIIPCYNTKEEYLFSCINSVIKQSFRDFEIIIVDDGSKEVYREIYKRLEELDARIKIIFKENSGVSSSRNIGVEQAEGEFIIFVDSDDVLLPHFFNEAYEVIKKYDADIVYGCNIHLNSFKKENADKLIGDGEVRIYEREEIKSFLPYLVGEKLRFNQGIMSIGHGPWTRIIKRDLAKNTRFNGELKYGEDVIWNIQLLSKASRICCVQRGWYLYNANLQSITMKFNADAIIQAEKALAEIQKLLNFQNEMEYKAFCDRCFIDMIRICKNAIRVEGKLDSKYKDRLYRGIPWIKVKEKRYWNLATTLNKVRIILYRCRIFFFVYEIKYWILKR